MPDFRPRIAIVGGGPSGLALGRLLHQRGIETTIYELRERATPEQLTKPSGMLDLHEESGLAAMRECGLWEGFEAAVGDCSEAMRVLNHNGDVLYTDEGELSTRPEIPGIRSPVYLFRASLQTGSSSNRRLRPSREEKTRPQEPPRSLWILVQTAPPRMTSSLALMEPGLGFASC